MQDGQHAVQRLDRLREKVPHQVSGRLQGRAARGDAARPAQLSLRFPAIHEGDKKLVPLTRPVPLTQSRVSDIARKATGTSVSRELTRLAHSYAQGRSISYNDPVVAEQEAEARIDAGFVFRWATSLRAPSEGHAQRARRARHAQQGGAAPRQRPGPRARAARNARAASRHPEANTRTSSACPRRSWDPSRRRSPCTKTARDDGRAGRGGLVRPVRAREARKRLEIERNREVLNSAMDCDPEI